MRKIKNVIKFIPFFLLGIAVIVWGMVFQKKESDSGVLPMDQEGGPIFPY